MTTTVKVLQRKDATSVTVAIIIALLGAQLLNGLTNPLVGVLSADGGDYTIAAADFYIPLAAFAAELIVLEILLAFVVAVRYLVHGSAQAASQSASRGKSKK